jgi:transcription-repair coupling factor (superfamily II helicase)
MPSSYQQFLLEQMDRSQTFARFMERGWEAGDFARWHGLLGGVRALAVARTHQRSAEQWIEDFDQFGVEGLNVFSMSETLPFEAEEPTVDIVARQFGTLYYLLHSESASVTTDPSRNAAKSSVPSLIVAPLEALQMRLPSREDAEPLFRTIRWGDRLETESLVDWLIEIGYDREGMAEARGEFSWRGNILDIYAPHMENPVRIDLFGDEVESIRWFDPATQRSLRDTEELERVTLMPAKVREIADRLTREGGAGRLVSLCDWLPDDTLCILDRPEKYDPQLEQYDRIVARRYAEATQTSHAPVAPEIADPDRDFRVQSAQAIVGPDGEPLPVEAFFVPGPVLRKALERFAQVHLPQLDIREEGAAVFDFQAGSFESLPPELDTYLSLIRKKHSQDFSIHIVCDNEGQVMRLDEVLREHEIGSRQLLSAQSAESKFMQRDVLNGFQDIVLSVGPLHSGFVLNDAQLMILTDREIFGRYKRRPVRRRAYKGKPVGSVTDIVRGDLVVHADHGIGQFIGVRRQLIDGREAELVELEYAEGNKLLVPIEQVGRIQKYSSVEGAAPTLDRLGGKRWQARKKKSSEKIEQMARELLEIYAQREAAEGFAFSPDSAWQQEFEDSFIYQETPDQLRAIAEVKKDMTTPKPMDRLLCGDVGFGKTEVAMRAVFKCVQEKRQCAVLVPTTVLAQQHYATFRERFAEYPARIEVISRFRTDGEISDVLRRLKAGEVDVVIGTHRLLSQDVKFADLGLLVVDEEHRFGVQQKEKFKALRASIDILTLSATPIPRTLHMALSGLRDMSTINTPPRDRLPVRTRVIRFVAEEIEEAILRELNRGGQIYFVHNRVQSIHRVADRLTEIVPQARIAVAHGQMHERELERVMFEFVDRKYDILLSTTIIESGLDIPNVNTIIINRADALGLAQLYQLRGRVGRDVRRAYAYLIVPEGRPITDTAVKRLRAIEEFTELGVGFQVAMRDLEIRGTGNILGAEQHGAIEAIGFELYCQMLEEAVMRMRGKDVASDLTVEVRWPMSALLPAEYVPVEPQRVSFYKRCASARELADLEDIADELRDRYGELPVPARNLIGIGTLRLLARGAGIDRIVATPKGLRFSPRGDLFDFLRRVRQLEDTNENVTGIEADSSGSVLVILRKWNMENGLERAIEIVKELK